jgi:hypothetical protein
MRLKFWRKDEDENYVTKYCKICKKYTRHIKRGFGGCANYIEECLEHG